MQNVCASVAYYVHEYANKTVYWKTRPKHNVVPMVNKHQLMKMYGELEAYLHVFLTSALKGEAWAASLYGRFILGERASGIYWKAGLLRESL